jgi:hypothetical protein
MRCPNAGTGSSFGQSSTFSVVRWPQALQVTSKESGPRLRMFPSVSGPVGCLADGAGSSFLGAPSGGLPMRKGYRCGRCVPTYCRTEAIKAAAPFREQFTIFFADRVEKPTDDKP